MSSNRQDAWSQQEDEQLAQIILQSIEKGQTQLDAFTAVGKKLNRTAAACGFRWNSYVRKLYENEILQAKKKKKENKLKNRKLSSVHKEEELTNHSPLNKIEVELPSLEVLCSYIEKLYAIKESELQEATHQAKDYVQLEELNQKIDTLEQEKKELVRELNLLQEEFAQLGAIINKANALVGK